jgi:hypothetical protein
VNVGLRFVESTIPSLSKSHAQLVGTRVDASVNLTVSGAGPHNGVAVNPALGAPVAGGGGGGVAPPKCTHLATDGTPLESTTTSM